LVEGCNFTQEEQNGSEEKMPMQKTDLKAPWKIAPVDEQNFPSLLKMMADYQRFYGVEEPDEEKTTDVDRSTVLSIFVLVFGPIIRPN